MTEGVVNDPPFSYRVLYVQCIDCGIQTAKEPCDGYYGIKFTPEQMAEKWNRRAGNK